MAKITFQKKYGVTPDSILNSLDLSFKAKGMYGFIQSKPDGWHFSAYRISKQGKDGIDGVKAGLQELEAAGLLVRIQGKSKDGGWNQIDYQLIDPDVCGFTVGGKAVDGKTVDGKATNISKTENSKTESSKTKTSIASAEAAAEPEKEKHNPLGAEIIEAFGEINAACKKMYGHKVQRQACDDLIAEHGFDVVLKIVKTVLPKTNDMAYITTITTPKQLLDKYATLASQVRSQKSTQAQKAPVFM